MTTLERNVDTGNGAEALASPEVFMITPIVFIMLIRTIDNKKQIYLQLKKSTGLWTLPGGHLEDGETSKAATVRETEEEIGVDINRNDLRLRYIAQIKDAIGQRVIFFHETSSWRGEPYNKEPEKCDDVNWFNVDDLPENMNANTKRCLEEIQTLPEGEIVYREYGFKSPIPQ